jgi:hypothetical protein
MLSDQPSLLGDRANTYDKLPYPKFLGPNKLANVNMPDSNGLPSGSIVSGIFDGQSQVTFLRETERRLYIARVCDIDSVERESSQGATPLARVWITGDARSVGVDGIAGIVCPD